jgi:hypothetical protein
MRLNVKVLGKIQAKYLVYDGCQVTHFLSGSDGGGGDLSPSVY